MKNGFNLNISRYIPTAISEEKVDLPAVNTDLLELERKIVAAIQKHNEFLKALGLSSLPLTSQGTDKDCYKG